MRLIAKGLLAALVLLLAACTTPTVRLQPIPKPEQAFQLGYFSVRVPGTRWYLLDRKPVRIAFARFGGEWQHSFGAEMQVFRVNFDYSSLQDFAQKIRARREGAGNEARFELLQEKESALRFNGMLCSRYHLEAKDTGARNRGTEPYLILVTEGMTCAHPEEKQFITELRFFQRGRRGKMNKGPLPEAERFFASLQWNKPGSVSN